MLFETEPKDAIVSPNTAVKPDEKQPVYWFKKKETGEIFATKETEAWNLLKGRSKVKNRPLQWVYLGRSDGGVYFRGLDEMRTIFQEKGLEPAQEFLRSLQQKEAESADPSVMPRNQDVMGDPAAIREFSSSSIV